MKLPNLTPLFAGILLSLGGSVTAQEEFENTLCEAAKNSAVVALVYDRDRAKGCEPRLFDVHQFAIGKNGKYYVHGWQTRGCTKGRDYASKRVFRLDKIKSVDPETRDFSAESLAAKAEGWDGCLGNNCFIERILCD